MKHDLEEKILKLWCCATPVESEDLKGALCGASKILAQTIFDLVPECPERTLAIRRLQECTFWTNQALCCDQEC